MFTCQTACVRASRAIGSSGYFSTRFTSFAACSYLILYERPMYSIRLSSGGRPPFGTEAANSLWLAFSRDCDSFRIALYCSEVEDGLSCARISVVTRDRPSAKASDPPTVRLMSRLLLSRSGTTPKAGVPISQTAAAATSGNVCRGLYRFAASPWDHPGRRPRTMPEFAIPFRDPCTWRRRRP